MIRAVLVLLCCAGAARAEPLGGTRGELPRAIELPNTKAKLVLGDGWRTVATKGLVAAYKHDRGALLAVTRADVPNPDAWVVEKKQAYIDQVEKGIKAKLPAKRFTKKIASPGFAGARRNANALRSMIVDAGGVPALDVEARRDGGATVVMRVLLFRTYALAIAIEVPKSGDVVAARAIAKAFAPPREPEHHND